MRRLHWPAHLMPKDDRIWGKFAVDMPDNPKILPLSDAAFRCLIEATLYSRRMLTDGFLATRLATAKWPLDVLAELCSNDTERPSMFTVDGGYMIRDYADHQDTRAEVETRRAINRANGSKGGQARAKRVGSKSVSETQAETEEEAETVTTPNGVVRAKRAHSIPENFAITQRMRDWASEHTPLVDIDARLPEFIDYWRGVGRPMKDWESVWHNGMRKQQGFAEKDAARPRGATLTRTEQNMAAVARIAAQEAAEQRGIAQ